MSSAPGRQQPQNRPLAYSKITSRNCEKLVNYRRENKRNIRRFCSTTFRNCCENMVFFVRRMKLSGLPTEKKHCNVIPFPQLYICMLLRFLIKHNISQYHRLDISRFDITQSIQHDNKGRVLVWLWADERHPISRTSGKAMGCWSVSRDIDRELSSVHWWWKTVDQPANNPALTDRGRMKSIYADSTMPQHWFRLWLIACPASRHYLKQCPGIINRTLRNPLGTISTKMQNTVCKMEAICTWPRVF